MCVPFQKRELIKKLIGSRKQLSSVLIEGPTAVCHRKLTLESFPPSVLWSNGSSNQFPVTRYFVSQSSKITRQCKQTLPKSLPQPRVHRILLCTTVLLSLVRSKAFHVSQGWSDRPTSLPLLLWRYRGIRGGGRLWWFFPVFCCRCMGMHALSLPKGNGRLHS